MKRLYIASDIHDDIESLEKFVDYAQAKNADNILLLGDLSLRPYNKDSLDRLIESKDLGNFVEEKRIYNSSTLNDMRGILDDSGISYNVIPGNYDSNFSDIFGKNNLHLNSRNIGEAKISGYGGADDFPAHIKLLNDIGEIVNFNHNELYDFLDQEKPDIGIIHNPPKGYCDDFYDGRHVGTPSSTQYIHENFPKLILSGHIHEAGPNGNNPNGVKGIRVIENDVTGDTTHVINPGNLGRFELINPRSLESDREFDYGTFVELKIRDDGTPKRLMQYALPKDNKKGVKGLADYALNIFK